MDMNLSKLTGLMPETTKATFIMRAFGLTKIPLLFMTSPRIVSITETECQVLIPLRKMVKNHLNSMYFGALAIGADTCIGMLAFAKMRKQNRKINLAFKDFKAQFLKRAEGDTLFVCKEGEAIDAMIEETMRTGERVNKTLKAQGLVNGEVVAEFELTLSLKAAGSSS